MELSAKRAAPWAIASFALLMVLRGLLAQVAIQADLNAAMDGVLKNVGEAGQLTTQTAEAMAPLASTARTLQTMNGRLREIGGELGAINGALERVTEGQGRMLEHLASLNERTRGLADTLTVVDARNRAMLQTNQGLSRQTEAQAAKLERLSVLTDESVSHLALLNDRLSFLR